MYNLYIFIDLKINSCGKIPYFVLQSDNNETGPDLCNQAH